MAKSSGFFDGAISMLNAIALMDRQCSQPPRRPSVKRTISYRQVYDAKKGKVITLKTETITGTKEY